MKLKHLTPGEAFELAVQGFFVVLGLFALGLGLYILFAIASLAKAQTIPAQTPSIECYPFLPSSCDGKVVDLPAFKRGATGWHIVWFWQPADTAYPVQSGKLMCFHANGDCITQAMSLVGVMMDCMTSSTPRACARDGWNSKVQWDCVATDIDGNTQRQALCEESYNFRLELAQERGIAWPTIPAEQKWVVSRSGMRATATSRPAYLLVDGQRLPSDGARAPLNGPDGNPQPCDCSVRSENYCAFSSDRTLVTLCRLAD